jgi:hypothetical protein
MCAVGGVSFFQLFIALLVFNIAGCTFKQEFHVEILNIGPDQIDSSEFKHSDNLFLGRDSYAAHQYTRFSGIYQVPPSGKVAIFWTIGEYTTRRSVPIEGEYGSEPNNLLQVYISTRCGRARAFWANDKDWEISRKEQINYRCDKFSDTEFIDAPRS